MRTRDWKQPTLGDLWADFQALPEGPITYIDISDVQLGLFNERVDSNADTLTALTGSYLEDHRPCVWNSWGDVDEMKAVDVAYIMEWAVPCSENLRPWPCHSFDKVERVLRELPLLSVRVDRRVILTGPTASRAGKDYGIGR